MRNGRYIALVLMAVIVLGGILLLAMPAAQREPIYDGKPLDVWFLGYRSPEPVPRARAVEVTDRFGTNAMPTLIRMLQANDPPIKRCVMDFLHEKSSYRIHYFSSRIRNCAAANACGHLGREAHLAVPALVELLKSDDTIVRDEAAAALKKIDPAVAAIAGVE